MERDELEKDEVLREGARQMAICNACRYCEGFCAVFPAMERRLDFARSDMNYLANLCHGCGECLYACQYAPPHEFSVNVPQIMARIRAESYRQYAWPAALAAIYRGNGRKLAVLLALCLVVSLFVASLVLGPEKLFSTVPGADFYALVPHAVMAWTYGVAALFAGAALLAGFVRGWRDMAGGFGVIADLRSVARGLGDALTLRNLHGSGAECTIREEHRLPLRRWFHHLTFYGFMSCFAATVAGALYHFGFGWKAPYPYSSLPVVLGTIGGAATVIGTAGLFHTARHADSALKDAAQRGMELGFVGLLCLSALSGLFVLALRDTAALGTALFIHLGSVLALFLALPCGKFVHGVYRSAALIKNALEQSRAKATTGVE